LLDDHYACWHLNPKAIMFIIVKYERQVWQG
jgi:hypothetical protein